LLLSVSRTARYSVPRWTFVFSPGRIVNGKQVGVEIAFRVAKTPVTGVEGLTYGRGGCQTVVCRIAGKPLVAVFSSAECSPYNGSGIVGHLGL
jgi:hypothetical protein